MKSTPPARLDATGMGRISFATAARVMRRILVEAARD